MNRHARRADMRTFRRSDLLTHCVAADVPLDDNAMLRNAALHWRSNIETRRPICIACKISFVGDKARAGAFLFAMPVNIGGLVSTSAFCTYCWDTLSLADIERIATRVLRQLSPRGHFLDQGTSP
jgi:hypothetical protein